MTTKPTIQPLHSLSLGEQYKQVGKQSNMRRLTKPAYTRLPEDQPVRWHIWYDGTEVISLLCDSTGWQDGPQLKVGEFIGGEGLSETVESILSGTYGKPYDGVGVIVHNADTQSLDAVVAKYDTMDRFSAVAVLAEDDPKQVILGISQQGTEGSSWRAFPVTGAKQNKIVFPRLLESDFKGVRKLEALDIPVSVTVRSATAEAITASSRMVFDIVSEDEEGAATTEKAHLVILRYKKGTCLYLMDQAGVILGVRYINHVSGKIPPQLEDEYRVLIREVPSAVKNVQVVIFNLWEGADTEVVQNHLIVVETGDITPEVLSLSWDQIPDLIETSIGKHVEVSVGVPLEVSLEYASDFIGEVEPLGKANLERMLLAAHQNYLEVSTAIAAAVASRSDMIFYIAGKGARVVMSVILVLIVGFLGVKIFRGVTSEAWKTPDATIDQSRDLLAQCLKNEGEFKRMEASLTPSTTGWQVMELILAMFPEDQNMKVESIHGDKVEGGKTTSWTITGVTTAEGLATIRSLQDRKNLETLVAKTCAAIGNTALLPDASHPMMISVKEEGNPGASGFPVRFTMGLSFGGNQSRGSNQ
jgi:hypothetical protein